MPMNSHVDQTVKEFQESALSLQICSQIALVVDVKETCDVTQNKAV